jgi:hypothetical protein
MDIDLAIDAGAFQGPGKAQEDDYGKVVILAVT